MDVDYWAASFDVSHGYADGSGFGCFQLLVPHEMLEINPRDAKEMGLEDGDLLDVSSRRGQVTVAARLTERSPRGLVFMSFAFPEFTRTNDVTSDAYDFITETPEFKACAVKIVKSVYQDDEFRRAQRRIRLAGEVKQPTEFDAGEWAASLI